MTPTNIEECLRFRFLSAIPAAGLATAFDNQKLEPAGRTVWFKFHFLPNTPDVATLGLMGWDEHTGILQIDIHVPKNTGRTVAKGYIDTLNMAFSPNAPLPYNGGVVNIRSCGQIPGGEDDNSFRFSVSATWQAMIERGPAIAFPPYTPPIPPPAPPP